MNSSKKSAKVSRRKTSPMSLSYVSPNKHMTNLYLAGKYKDCLKFIEKLESSGNLLKIQFNILKAGCWANLGICHKKAVKALNEVIAIQPLNAFAHYGLGFCYYVVGDLDKCIEPFTKAAELDKNSMARALQYKGNAASILTLLSSGKLADEPSASYFNLPFQS